MSSNCKRTCTSLCVAKLESRRPHQELQQKAIPVAHCRDVDGCIAVGPLQHFVGRSDPAGLELVKRIRREIFHQTEQEMQVWLWQEACGTSVLQIAVASG